ncbi:MAG: ribonuclease III [Tannerellaceae bacterium]
MFAQLYKRIRLLNKKNKEPYSSLYKILGFYPENVHLYEQAFLHKSSSIEGGNGKWVNNERLEFLGDALLDAIVADILYKHFQNKKEGFLTSTRAKIVQRDTLNRVAIELGLDKMVVYSVKLTSHNKHLYGNALEALVGAIYLDKGFKDCYAFVENVIMNRCINIDNLALMEMNFKSSLIEWSQKNKMEITFDLIKNYTDKDGNPIFQSGIYISDTQIGLGTGYSKIESQQSAAKMAIIKLRSDHQFQRFISDLKKKKTEENTAEHIFSELPIEAMSPEA